MPWDEFNSGIAELDGADVWFSGREIGGQSEVSRVATGLLVGSAIPLYSVNTPLCLRRIPSAGAPSRLRLERCPSHFLFMQKIANQDRGLRIWERTNNQAVPEICRTRRTT